MKEYMNLAARAKAAAAGFLSTADELTKLQTFIIAALILLVAAGGLIGYLRSRPRPVEIEETLPGFAESGQPGLSVHIAGSIVSPGLYELPEGSRVDDALKAAGGPVEGARLDDVNLAARLKDGQKIFVPGALEGDPEDEGAPQPAGGARGVNINTAGQKELEELPGIGPALADRILEYRRKNGPFSSVEDLMGVEGIGPRKLEALQDMATI